MRARWMRFELATSCLAHTFLNYKLTYTAIGIGRGMFSFEVTSGCLLACTDMALWMTRMVYLS